MTEVSHIQLTDDFGCYYPTDPDGYYIELKFVHDEIFGDTYAREIEALPATAPVVLDIGANVGLFTLRVKQLRPDATVVAFEPMPHTLMALRRNVELHEASNVTVHPMALGAEETVAEFTFYEQAPANSTRYPERKHLLAGLASKVHQVEVKPLSTVLAKHPELTTIDLVKIDVEGAENEVLAGLSDADWARISAFVIEVDEEDGRLDRMLKTLDDRGYTVEANYAPLIPEEQGIHVVHAVRQ